MFTKHLKIAAVIGVLMISFIPLVKANEPPPPAAGDEAKKGGGSTAKDMAPLPAWVELEGKITELSAKIKMKQAIIERLLHEKKEMANDSPNVKPLIQEIVKEHKEMQKMIEDYDKKRSTLRYRYPERGLKIERIYKKIEAKSLADVEAAVGVDGKLNRNLHRMRSQYGSSNPDPAVDHSLPNATPKQDNGSIENSGSVILRK